MRQVRVIENSKMTEPTEKMMVLLKAWLICRVKTKEKGICKSSNYLITVKNF
jgi:hypothetical protein